MSFLTPFFLFASAAIAIPIFVHLIQRERKRVIQFPSLMFVQRIPYQSVRRRRIRHWFFLLMRPGAVALVVRALGRPLPPEARGAARGDRRREPRGRGHARSIGEHGLRRSLAESRRGGARRGER